MKINMKLKAALENSEAYIKQMMALDDKKLARNIDMFQQQIIMAFKQGNTAALETLYVYEHQTISARILKMEAMEKKKISKGNNKKRRTAATAPPAGVTRKPS